MPSQGKVVAGLDAGIAELQRELDELRRQVAQVETDLEDMRRMRTRFAAREQRGTVGDLFGTPAAVQSALSATGLAIQILSETGRPMHIDELMRDLATRGAKATKSTIVGQLARYVRKGRLTRPAPSTYASQRSAAPKIDAEEKTERQADMTH